MTDARDDPERTRRCRAGVSAVEALVALVLGLVLTTAGLSLLARQRTLHSTLILRSDALVTLRTVRHTLSTEGWRAGGGGGGWHVGRDSVSVRAFRGVALVCPGDLPPGRVRVWYRGDRDADPEKDSLIWWEEPGGWTTAALEWIDGGGTCPGAREDVATSVWTLSRTPGNDVRLVRLFERGSYHLQGAALRYRRGAGGRQPLTPETLSRSGSGFALAGGGIVVWEVEVPDMGAPGKGAWRGVAGKVESGG